MECELHRRTRFAKSDRNVTSINLNLLIKKNAYEYNTLSRIYICTYVCVCTRRDILYTCTVYSTSRKFHNN